MPISTEAITMDDVNGAIEALRQELSQVEAVPIATIRCALLRSDSAVSRASDRPLAG